MDSIPDEIPFRRAWCGLELCSARLSEGMYTDFPLENPIAWDFDGSFDWLGPVTPADEEAAGLERRDRDRARVAELASEAEYLGLQLPASYVRFMSTPALRERVPEYYGSWFSWPERIAPCIGYERGWLIRFMNDQQDCLMWFLCLTPDGEEFVVHRGARGNGVQDEWAGWNEGAGPTEDERAAIIANTVICAPSFEAFIHRFWFEGVLDFKLDVGHALTTEEEQYLAYYTRLDER